MTKWREHKKKRPLRGDAKRTYEGARQEIGVGSLILRARAAAGLSQAQLAKKIGTSQPMIARWESGSQLPSVRSLLRVAEASGFDLALALHKQGSGNGEFQILSWARAVEPRRKAGSTIPVREQAEELVIVPMTAPGRAAFKRSRRTGARSE